MSMAATSQSNTVLQKISTIDCRRLRPILAAMAATKTISPIDRLKSGGHHVRGIIESDRRNRRGSMVVWRPADPRPGCQRRAIRTGTLFDVVQRGRATAF